MGSRTAAGARILKTTNLRSVRHTGEKLPIHKSDDDGLVARQENTSNRPPNGDATRGV